MKIFRNDLTRQAQTHMDEFLKEAREVLLSGKYILGERLQRFERDFAVYCGVQHVVGVASGTEALYLALKALDVREGDEVITTPFSFIGTVTAILMAGAKPVFVDICPETFNMDPDLIVERITKRTKFLMPVHLYGLLSDMHSLGAIAKTANIAIIEDAAQAHGSTLHGKKAGTFGHMACYSFYPSKNLGAYGDAGAIATNSEDLDSRLRVMRNYGQQALYECVSDGVNSRLDELQAAFLTVKLRFLDAWNERRRAVAALYEQHLPREFVKLPQIPSGYSSNFHVFAVRVSRRAELMDFLEKRSIQTNIYYPIPLHLQKGFSLSYRPGDFPHAERAAAEVLALPMYADIPDEYVLEVCQAIRQFYDPSDE